MSPALTKLKVWLKQLDEQYLSSKPDLPACKANRQDCRVKLTQLDKQ
jgi:hypothetical protein